MTALDQIKIFLTTANDVSFGYSEINFCSPDSLDEWQIGYGVDANGNSWRLVTTETGFRYGWLLQATNWVTLLLST